MVWVLLPSFAYKERETWESKKFSWGINSMDLNGIQNPAKPMFQSSLCTKISFILPPTVSFLVWIKEFCGRISEIIFSELFILQMKLRLGDLHEFSEDGKTTTRRDRTPRSLPFAASHLSLLVSFLLFCIWLQKIKKVYLIMSRYRYSYFSIIISHFHVISFQGKKERMKKKQTFTLVILNVWRLKKQNKKKAKHYHHHSSTKRKGKRKPWWLQQFLRFVY